MSRVEIKVWFFRFFFRTLACLLAWRLRYFVYEYGKVIFQIHIQYIGRVGVGGKKRSSRE